MSFTFKYSCLYDIQQKETYQARIDEMEMQSVSNNKEMKDVTRDMKTVSMLFDFNNLIT